MQINQCFGKSYLDPVNSSSQSVHECWVVANHPIGENAIEAIRSGMGNGVHKENVDFIGIDKMWTLIEQYMPIQATLQKLEDVRQDFETLDTHYRLEAYIDGSGIHQRLVEKYPGAAQEKPLSIKSVFEFPDTEDGREHQKALEWFLETGAPTKIPAAYIKSLEYSDFLQHVYPAMTKDGFLQLGSLPHPKPLLLKCEICCDDGDRFALDYIHLICTQVGYKEVTLTNDGQPIPIRVQLVLHLNGTVSSFHMSLDHDIPLNVHQMLMQMRLLRCFSKPHTVYFTNLETGMFAGYSRNETGVCDAPDENTLEALTALDALQIKSRRLVSLPDRELTDEEYQDIHMLRTLLRTGKIGATWNSSSASVVVTDDDREEIGQMLKRLAEDGGFVFLQQEEILTLFGEQYALGPIRPMSLPAKLVNWLEVKALLDQGYCGELCLQFVPNDDGHFTKEFIQWLPESGGTPDIGSLQRINEEAE